MKLGANSVLFGGYDMETAFNYTARCGYDGIEISAIGGMSQHLVVERWQECAPAIKALSGKYNLPILAMEQPSQDPATMEAAFQAAVAIGCPIINCGPGGKSNDEALDPQHGTVRPLGDDHGRDLHGVPRLAVLDSPCLTNRRMLIC